MNILVTGVNGFIGSYISKILKLQGDFVLGCGRSSNNDNPCVDSYHKWDLGNENAPEALISMNIDCIVHAASLVGPYNDDIELINSNIVGTYRIYHFAKLKKVRSVILLGGIPIAGLHCNVVLNENSMVNPQTMYHATKAAQELILQQLSYAKIRFCTLRIPSPIGPGQPAASIVPIFINKAINNDPITLLGKGTRKQNYVDVRDVANCVDFLCKTEETQGVYVIGADRTVSNYELAQLCISLADSQSPIEFSEAEDPCDDDDWLIDSSRINNCGFTLQYSIEHTLHDMIMYNAK